MRKSYLRLASPGRLAMVAALTLSGCAVGPDFQRPQIVAPGQITRGEDPTATNAPIAADWWRAYGSGKLDALVRRALEHNPTLASAEARLQAAQHLVAAQQGYFYPLVQAGYSGSRQGVGNTLSSSLANGNSVYTLHTAQLSVSYAPDVFGGNRRQVESLQAQANMQRYQIDAARVTLASNVAAAVIQAVALAEQIDTSQALVAVATSQLEHLRSMRDRGYSSGLDVAGQEAALAQALALIEPLRRQYEQTLDLIANLCGAYPGEQLALPGVGELALPAALPTALPSGLVAQRPDVRAAEEGVRASNAQIGVALASRLPQFSITALLGASATAISSLFSAGNGLWGVGAGVGQTVFAGGTLVERQRAAEAGLTAAEAQYRATVLSAFQNVADTLYALSADRRAAAAARSVESANERSLALTQSQVDRGYAAPLALLPARQTLLQARLARQQADAIVFGDTVALYQSLGGGWQDASTEGAVR